VRVADRAWVVGAGGFGVVVGGGTAMRGGVWGSGCVGGRE